MNRRRWLCGKNTAIYNTRIPLYNRVSAWTSISGFSDVKEKDKVVIVNKQNKPQAVIISYDRYIRLKEKDNLDI